MIDKKDRKEFVKQTLVIAATLFVIVNITIYIGAMVLTGKANQNIVRGIITIPGFRQIYSFATLNFYAHQRGYVPISSPDVVALWDLDNISAQYPDDVCAVPLWYTPKYLSLGIPLPYMTLAMHRTKLDYVIVWIVPLIIDIILWVMTAAIIVWYLRQEKAQKQLSNMLGIGLVLYAMLLTPAYFLRRGYWGVLLSGGIAPLASSSWLSVLLFVWIVSGCAAAFTGMFLVGKTLLKRFGMIKVKSKLHSWLAFIVILILSAIFAYVVLHDFFITPI